MHFAAITTLKKFFLKNWISGENQKNRMPVHRTCIILAFAIIQKLRVQKLKKKLFANLLLTQNRDFCRQYIFMIII